GAEAACWRLRRAFSASTRACSACWTARVAPSFAFSSSAMRVAELARLDFSVSIVCVSSATVFDWGGTKAEAGPGDCVISDAAGGGEAAVTTGADGWTAVVGDEGRTAVAGADGDWATAAGADGEGAVAAGAAGGWTAVAGADADLAAAAGADGGWAAIAG